MSEQEYEVRNENEDAAVETETVEIHVDAEETEGKAQAKPEEQPRKDTATHIKDALKQVETFGQALGEALQARGNVVMVRVNDEALEHLDMLIEAEVTKSRSESAAFLINEGVKANQELFNKIGVITQQIASLREQLRAQVNLEPSEE